MASGGSGGGASIGAPPGKQVPRDIIVMQSLLREMGINRFELRLLNHMLEYVYRYVTSVAEEARVYSVYAKKKSIDLDDVKLAVKVLNGKSYSTVPPREMLLDLAKSKNNIPLPLLKTTSGLRLPPDRFCLTQPNYQLQFYKRAIASSSLMSGSKLSSSTSNASLFKTPSGMPLRTVVATGNASSPSNPSTGEPDPKKQRST